MVGNVASLLHLAGYAQSRNVALEIFTNARVPSRGELFDLVNEGVVYFTPF